MIALLTYLKNIRRIKESGIATDERSYYPALATLLDTVGATLTPKVVAIHDITSQDSGHPDYALQVENTHDIRAVIEAKPAKKDVTEIISQTK
jgi:hypothetical protein